VTLGHYGPPNFLVFLLENRSYEMTGGQGYAPEVDFVTLARGAGIEKVERIEDLATLQAELPRLLTEPGPHFVVLPVTNSEQLPPVAHTDHAGRVTNLRRALGVG
jgi:thiamine pyrophosphate-dependent acetolactate synthase large subunit-like protein